MGNPCTLEVHDEEDPVRVVVWAVNNCLAVEFTVSLVVLNLGKETDGRFHPQCVTFTHSPDDVAEIERILACVVRAEIAWSDLEMSRGAWHLPFRRSDPVLRRVLEQQADEIIARLPSADGVAFDVRRALAKRIARGDTRIDSVALDLATRSRTLQRRLAAGGLSLSGSGGVDAEGGGRKISHGSIAVDCRGSLPAGLLRTERLAPSF